MNDTNDTGQKDNQPDLDLIQMVQMARMAHDSDAKPSEIAAVYWIECKRQEGEYPPPTPRSGEWIIETDTAQVDMLWAQVKAATEQGKLGYKSKVSTASRKLKDANQRVICVRTYDVNDRDDVARIKSALLALGIDEASLSYSRDHLT